MRDLGPDEAEVNRGIANGITDVLTQAGFRTLDTPIIEQTDLFVRKSGGEIAGSLYTFSDPGGIGVSLRPEFTPSVIRWYIENVSLPSEPHRYQYSGPVFRYGGSRGARFRQFHQVGGELIGVPGSAGDIEILLTALRCLESAGIAGFRVKIGHIGIIRELVRAQGLSEPLGMLVMSNLHEIGGQTGGVDRLEELAAGAGLVLRDAHQPDLIQDWSDPAIEALGHSISMPTGRRTPEQIMMRLVNRMRQAAPISEFKTAVDNVYRLISTSGSPSEVTTGARQVLADSGAPVGSVDDLDATLAALEGAGVGESAIQADLSFVRGLDYYTGIVFEFQAGEGGYAFGGGGRYDDLVRAFGGADVPACGFALNTDELAWRPAKAESEGRR